ncbi:peptide ABC transporter ATP-binding protein [Paenibacillus radicis (ex Gao et al. 2016)]|uniref:Peptide ABC transporter ATP-binding protein n=2 Tax=Paenibacillus radicis (ex Gao et al. 2016) TaxID=1737354 RepID=A0A917LY90_9BACL|nr:oligopeptide/dipeptide ABC transporter ATP-binding protein [Paenibacillus radicis (ex Gao et al. 2016)]GGG63651.1 peptide ABC transporter ATP-binding protein [Paenibacillus radicis (ex Gao et al. 2016)]
MPSSVEPIMELIDIRKQYGSGVLSRKHAVRAVDGISLTIKPGETLGLVGESGCGKSTVGQIAARLLEPSDGNLHYKGQTLAGHKGAKRLRQQIQYVFQDPYTSLNPSHTIGKTLEQPLIINRLGGDSKGRKRLVKEMLSKIGLDDWHADSYPHQLSGGQRQRVGIARALMLNPEFIVLDEPVSALDVSVQAQILNLLKELQQELSLTYLFISHDLNVVHYMSDRVAVMYLGQIVELADVQQLYERPLHPYTQALVSAIPAESRHTKRERIVLHGELPSASERMSGCAFRTRCHHAHERCAAEQPSLAELEPGHWVRCHLHSLA